MSEQEFRNRVANAAPFDSADQADRVARAALSGLGNNITEGEAVDLAEHFPKPDAGEVHDVDEHHRSPSPTVLTGSPSPTVLTGSPSPTVPAGPRPCRLPG